MRTCSFFGTSWGRDGVHSSPDTASCTYAITGGPKCAYVLPAKAMVLVSNLFPLVVVAPLVGWTTVTGERGRARSAAAEAALTARSMA
ncbi:hypothetical protein [Streptomyces klenkii]